MLEEVTHSLAFAVVTDAFTDAPVREELSVGLDTRPSGEWKDDRATPEWRFETPSAGEIVYTLRSMGLDAGLEDPSQTSGWLANGLSFSSGRPVSLSVTTADLPPLIHILDPIPYYPSASG